MMLRHYIDKYGINIRKFSRSAKISEATIHNVLKGFDIKLSVALKIIEITQGEVTCQDLKPTRQRGIPVKKKRAV